MLTGAGVSSAACTWIHPSLMWKWSLPVAIGSSPSLLWHKMSLTLFLSSRQKWVLGISASNVCMISSCTMPLVGDLKTCVGGGWPPYLLPTHTQWSFFSSSFKSIHSTIDEFPLSMPRPLSTLQTLEHWHPYGRIYVSHVLQELVLWLLLHLCWYKID